MSMCLKAAVIAAVVLVTGCANVGVSSKVDAAVVGLTAAEKAALIYTRLARCPQPGSTPCSDPATVAKIISLDNQAYQAVKAAEQNEALLSAALSAVTNLSSAIPAPAQ